MTTSREEFIALISRGGVPEKAEANIARVRGCLAEVLAALPRAGRPHDPTHLLRAEP